MLQHDMENEPDVLAMVAASAALTICRACRSWARSALPASAMSTARTCSTRPPTTRSDTKLDLVVAGTADAVLMVESEARSSRREVMLGAVMFGHESGKRVIDAIIAWPRRPPRSRARVEPDDGLPAPREGRAEGRRVKPTSRAAYNIPDKAQRYARGRCANAKVKDHFASRGRSQAVLRAAGAGRRRPEARGRHRPR
ncbi:MAG: hypothetical protein NVV63_11645 [Opitutus sp.]|nr:hypothetical protein [Opitutus sp.]